MLSSPFPSEIEAAPAGGHVAWIQNDRGSRNVWIASAPEFAARRITAFTGDDGQEIANLVWSPDGKAVVFVRGGEPNRLNEIPNPGSLADAAEQALWAVDVAGGDARKLVQDVEQRIENDTGWSNFVSAVAARDAQRLDPWPAAVGGCALVSEAGI